MPGKLQIMLPLLLPLLLSYAAGGLLSAELRVLRELLAQSAQLEQEQRNPAAIQAELTALQERINDQQEQLRGLSGGLPDPEVQSDIIGFLTAGAREEGLQLLHLRPGAAGQPGSPTHIPVALTLRGDFASLLRLLNRLENQSAGYRCLRLIIRADKQGAVALPAELELQAIAREQSQ